MIENHHLRVSFLFTFLSHSILIWIKRLTRLKRPTQPPQCESWGGSDWICGTFRIELVPWIKHALLGIFKSITNTRVTVFPFSPDFRAMLPFALYLSRPMSTIRFDGASEFGKSSSFIAYCTQHDIVREPLASYTHIHAGPAYFWLVFHGPSASRTCSCRRYDPRWSCWRGCVSRTWLY